jgi:hypothetical protein
MAKGLKGVDTSKLSKFSGDLTLLGKAGVTGFVSAFTNSSTTVTPAVTTMMQYVKNQIAAKQTELVTAMQGVISALVHVIMTKTHDMTSVTTTMMNEVSKAIKAKKSDFETAGKYIVEGLADGINKNKSKAINAAIDVATKALKAAKHALGEKSPSKEFAKVGMYADLGLAGGLTDYADTVTSSASKVGETAINGLSSAISKVSDVIDGNMELSPTIRPVLDLSDVTSGAQQINGVLSANRSMALGLSVSRDTESTNAGLIDDLTSKIQELSSSSNSKVVKAIESLKGDIGTLADVMGALKVVLDTGTLVGAIAPEMDRSLGRLSVYDGRRI